MKRILVIETNEKYSQRLLTVLNAAGLYIVTLVTTMREAALMLTQQPYDLILAPLSGGEDLVKSLRTVQANLPIVLTATEGTSRSVPVDVQGLLLLPTLEVDLPGLLANVLDEETERSDQASQQRGIALNLAPIKEMLHKQSWAEPVQAAVLSYGPKRLLSWGVLSKPEMSALVGQVDHYWRNERRRPGDAQIQFWSRNAETSNPLIVYSRATIHGMLLTIVAVSQLTITELRIQADRAAEKLAALNLQPAPADPPVTAEPLTSAPPTIGNNVVASTINSGRSTVSADIAPPEASADSGRIYAAIWRARHPLPESVLARLDPIFEQIAQENGCLIKHKMLRSDLAHLVVACPPGRNSVWLVHLFKQQSEARMAARFGLETGLWARGYYAAESDKPLSEAEMQLFLEREPT